MVNQLHKEELMVKCLKTLVMTNSFKHMIILVQVIWMLGVPILDQDRLKMPKALIEMTLLDQQVSERCGKLIITNN